MDTQTDIYDSTPKSSVSIEKQKTTFFVKVFYVVVFIAALFIIKNEVYYSLYYLDDQEIIFDDLTTCNVLGVQLVGGLVTYASQDEIEEHGFTLADEILFAIDDAQQDEETDALILEIDSWGGSPVAADEIADALKRFTKPSVVYIRGAGVSGAYWAATGADYIFATKNSDVGSIGVTMSYVENSEQNENAGLKYISLSSGEFKEAGDPNKELTEEERTLFERDIDIVYNNFIDTVSENRSLLREDVKKIADGSSVIGQMAQDLGLVDKIGTFYDVREYVENLIGAEAEVCWYFTGEETEYSEEEYDY
ncbi:MAG: signal peptide peptidase SppA [Candidatus Pacebacteria bacterium]|nr:signal peptide peptidase SppA [Candidatus Paceibacterota bacterium]